MMYLVGWVNFILAVILEAANKDSSLWYLGMAIFCFVIDIRANQKEREYHQRDRLAKGRNKYV